MVAFRGSSSCGPSAESARKEMDMADGLTVKIEPYGLDERTHERTTQGLAKSGALRSHLSDASHRLLRFELLEPQRKSEAPKPQERFRATYYDYAENRAVHAEG